MHYFHLKITLPSRPRFCSLSLSSRLHLHLFLTYSPCATCLHLIRPHFTNFVAFDEITKNTIRSTYRFCPYFLCVRFKYSVERFLPHFNIPFFAMAKKQYLRLHKRTSLSSFCINEILLIRILQRLHSISLLIRLYER